ncbi:rho GTPase-activating protein 45-like isoform X2 [Watersipora subatra]|uniref:rho GTPase-activating protein 45-like isoform X2 n=1 Tax=Watersipora subatra TaxID=2589382 RepID=UPI00355B896E
MPSVPMDQDTVLSLTQDVRTFSDYLAKLHNAIYKQSEVGEALRVTAHERLGEVLCILKSILKKYPAVNSTDLLTSTGVLISKIKGCNYQGTDAAMPELKEAIDQLALSFSSSVSEYLMGDMDTSFSISLATPQNADSSSMSRTDIRQTDIARELLSPAKMDAHLKQMETGVEHALDRAKAWSKYAKDVIYYVEKRTQLEADFARGLSKLAQTTRPVIMENSFLPFQSIFGTALDQDKDFANTSQAACTLVQSQKFVEPLSQRRAEHEKARKLLREEWSKEVKRMNDAIANLKKAKIIYYQRYTEYERVKDTTSKMENEALGSSLGQANTKQLEKKKKATDDMYLKAAEAETTYKSCVHEANVRRTELEKTKGVILSQVRELITLCERTMKAAAIAYFQLQHTVSAPAPVQYQTLCENCRGYEPGMQYSEYVRRLPPDDSPQHEAFVFEPYHQSRNDDHKNRKTSNFGLLESPSTNKVRTPGDKAGSESESVSSGNKSGDNSPSASPYSAKRFDSSTYHPSSGSTVTLSDASLYKSQTSKDVEKHLGHTFKKLKTPSRCRVCDSYVYFNSMECEQCRTACHKKCLLSLTNSCGSSPLERRMTLFGVSFDDHIQNMNVEVPNIVTQCIEEIDKRGLDMKGIYRISGVKSKVEKLCQSFECGGMVDLSQHHPNVISNVLKLYLRQLPEPLLTVALYQSFVDVARDQSSRRIDEEEVIARLKSIVDQLPPANLKTTATIIHHLKRVSDLESENQMNPSNLGIVFGPTLLRPSEGPVNLNSLIDTAHQTRAVELLIVNSTVLFGPDLVKLTRQATAAGESLSDTDSLASESSSSNRLNSMDSTLADDIITALAKPASASVNNSEEHLECIDETSDVSKGTTELPGMEKLSIYHTQVMKSASMPFPKHTSSSVEKSASVEFKIVSHNGKAARCEDVKSYYNNPVMSHTYQYSAPRAAGQLYSALPVTLVTPQLPDIGAPDITEELMQNERRLSMDSTFLNPRSSRTSGSSAPSKSKISASFNENSRSAGKAIFYTHSMKKKSTEPKFV